MSTTDLESYITTPRHFCPCERLSVKRELLAQPHNLVRHPDMPKAAFVDMWYTLKQGEPRERHCENRRKKRHPLLGEGQRGTDDNVKGV